MWSALRTIPYGQCVSYLDIAKKIGRPTSVRAVANAIGETHADFYPLPSSNSTSGALMAFPPVDLKRQLLELEAK